MLIIARKGLIFVEIKLKIDAPELAAAINNLAGALNGGGLVQPTEIKVDGKAVADTDAKETAPKKEKPKKTAPAKKAEPEPEPDAAEEATEEKASTGLTFEQVRVKLAEVSQAGKQKELKELITSMGAAKLSDIPEEQYAELLEKASEL